MAKRRYYRARRVYPKQKWLPVNNEIGLGSPESGLGASQFLTTVQPITENATRNITDGGGNVSSATIIKVGRIKMKGVILGSSSSVGVTYIIGIAYVPEGYIIDQTLTSINNLGNTFFYKHPEWIICWTRIDYTNAGQGNEFSMSSRLKRNLNSGDQIVFFRISVNSNTGTTLPASAIRATVSYVCRAN